MMLKGRLKRLIPDSIATRIGILIFSAGVVPLSVFGWIFIYSFTNTVLSNLESSIISLEKEQRTRMIKIMRETAQRYVRDRVIDVARQLDLYIATHPGLTLFDLRDDPEFRKLAVQPIGKTGYTALQTSKEPIMCVVHRDKSIEMRLLKSFAHKYPNFYKILYNSLNGRYSYGFYRWYDEREDREILKFMYIAPLMEKTADNVPLSVAATISLEEFMSPLKDLEHISERVKFSLLIKLKKIFHNYRLKGLITIFLVFSFLLIVTLGSGRFLSKGIQRIKRAFNEIKKGNFDVSIEPFTGGEIKELVEDFNNMVQTLRETTVKKDSLIKTKKVLEELNVELREYVKKLKKAETEKNILIQDLKVKTEELETFVYIISHDLRSPLITIRGFLYFLEEDFKSGDQEKVKQDIEYIKKACDSMDSLLKELLEFSRIGRKKEKFELVDLSEVIDEVLFLLSGAIEERGVKVEVKKPLPKVYGDRTRIKEVYQNLIENAIKYMGDQRNPKIEIGTKPKDGEEVVYVRDNGIGIAPEYHQKIFNLFEQLNSEAKGTGAGLAIVKKIIKLHKGKIWVESEEGRGSTFYVYIPQKKEE